MKKTFPIIVTLITISLLGIIYIQVNWINNTLKVRQEELSTKTLASMERVKNAILSEKRRYMLRLNGGEESSVNGISAKDIFNTFDMKSLVQSKLEEQGLKLEFEYSLQDEFGRSVMYSSGFKSEYFENPNIVWTQVSEDNSKNREKLYVYFVQPDMYVQEKVYGLLLSALLFTSVIIATFAITIRAILKQKKLSEIKNDFIANMTHEFKTPIATISLATAALNNERVRSDSEKIDQYTEIIKEENMRMNKQVETILQAAQMEKEELKLTLRKINVHEVINTVYDNTAIQVEEKQGSLDISLKASNPFINADEVHFSNIVFNLLDNAIKYSKEQPHVRIETENISGDIHIRFIDNGIGMSRDTINNIFEKFYRAHTGNLHNVKGFGLGLTYVKQVVDAHDARIKVQSTVGKGSTFTIVFDNAA
jgi:two-component system, OmpR family, phosphate regulon sensor histidine kinase PhoR